MPVLIEVNIGREESKGGIFPEALSDFCDSIKKYENIIPMGLMTIAPICEDKNDYNRYFSEMKRLKETVFTQKFPETMSPILSMGMSGSFSQALANGADIVRIGEGLFGKRNLPTKSD